MRSLFGLLAVLVRSDLSKDVELLVLRQENQVLRRQLSGQPRWGHADRLWLGALSWLIHRRRWAQLFPVTPATILRGTVNSWRVSEPSPAGAAWDGPAPVGRSRR